MEEADKILDDLIRQTEQSIVETEGIIQAQQGALVTYKKVKMALISKKESLKKNAPNTN